MIDRTLDDDDLALFILNGLGPEYRDLAANIHGHDTSISLNDLFDKVTSQVQYLKDQELNYASLVVNANVVQHRQNHYSPRNDKHFSVLLKTTILAGVEQQWARSAESYQQQLESQQWILELDSHQWLS